MRIILRVCPEFPSLVANNSSSTSTNINSTTANISSNSANTSSISSEQDDNSPLYFFEGTSYDNLTIYEKNVRQNGKVFVYFLPPIELLTSLHSNWTCTVILSITYTTHLLRNLKCILLKYYLL